jgi:ParB-like chromosome segregation protein Spo0J
MSGNGRTDLLDQDDDAEASAQRAEFTNLPVDALRPRADARPINEEKLDGVMKSFRDLSIMSPICVRPVAGESDAVYEIIFGRHRWEGAKRLGLTTVLCRVVDVDDVTAELMHIDENLMRAELGDTERAEATQRRKVLYEELHPETRHGAIGGGHDQSRKLCDSGPEKAPRFTLEIAEKTGKSERSIQLDVERAEKVSAEARSLIKGTPLDKGSYLDAIKNLPAEEQLAKVKVDLTKPVEKRKASKPKTIEAEPKQVKQPEPVDAAEPEPTAVQQEPPGFADAMAELVKAREIIDRLEIKVGDLEAENQQLKAGRGQLRAQVERLRAQVEGLRLKAKLEGRQADPKLVTDSKQSANPRRGKRSDVILEDDLGEHYVKLHAPKKGQGAVCYVFYNDPVTKKIARNTLKTTDPEAVKLRFRNFIAERKGIDPEAVKFKVLDLAFFDKRQEQAEAAKLAAAEPVGTA